MEEVGSRLIAQGADQYIRDMERAGQATDDFARGVDDAAGKADKGAGLFDTLGGVLRGGLVAGAGLAVGAIAGIGAAIIGSQERMAEFRAVLGQDFDVASFQAVNEQAALLERRFGVGLPEQLDAARQLVNNGLVPDMTAAFDVITAGFDSGLNVGDDFLDTLREYSPNFAALGITGDEALSLINRGLEAGARNSDVIADAVKEFGILIREPGTIEAVGAIDEKLGGIVTQFQNGQIAGDEALSLITTRLGEIEDPIDRNAAGIALFGTLYEDMGEKAILALGKTEEGLIASQGASDAAQARITSFSEILPRLGDKLGTALAPAGEAVLGFVNDKWPAFESAIDSGISTAGNFASALGGSKEALAQLPGPLQAVVGGVEDAKAAWEAFSQTELGERVISGAQRVGDYFANQFGPDVERGVGVVLGALDRLGQSEFGQDVQRGAEVVANYFLNQWPGDFERGVAIVQGELDKLAASPWAQDVQAGAGVVADYMANQWSNDFSRGVDLVIDAVTGLPAEVERVAGEVEGFVKGLPETIRSGASEIGTAIATGIESGFRNAWGRVEAWIAGQIAKLPEPVRKALGIGSPSKVMAEQVGQHLPSGVAQGILDNLNVLKDAAKEISWAVLDEAKGFADQISDAVGPMLVDGFEGAASYARSRLGSFDIVRGLAPDRSEVDRIAERTQEITERLNDALRAGDRVRIADLRDEYQQLVNESEEAGARLARQQEVQSRAAAQLREARAQADQLEDPAERAEFYQLRQQQIGEIAEAELAIVQARSDAERDELQQRLQLLREAQEYETRLAADAARKRREQLLDQIRIAQDAAKQLTNLVFYSQQDVSGQGDAQTQLVGSLIGSLLGGLGQQIGGPTSAYGLLTGMLGGGSSYSSVTNFNYNATYGAAPRSPMQDFAVMQSMYGGVY